MGLEPVATEWSLARRIAFRFVFVYFVLYILPFPLNALPSLGAKAGQWIWWAQQKYDVPWNHVVDWTAEHVFHVSAAVRPNGSGDTTYNYVLVFSMAVIAAAVAALWSLVGWKWKSHDRLHRWLRVYVRFYIASQMIIYGSIKVIKSQFPDPSLDRMLQPFGDASPMGILWTFMGASEPYNVFAGAGELLGGLLLTTRRTTLLGALVTIGVMGHVAALNFCYDVPVKLFSLHLLLMATWLLVPDANRLVRFFLLNRPTGSADVQSITGRAWLNWTLVGLRTLLVGAYVWAYVSQAIQGRAYMATQAKGSPLYGIWSVQELEIDGKPASELSDAKAWKRVVFDYPWLVAVFHLDGHRERHNITLSVREQTISQNTKAHPPKIGNSPGARRPTERSSSMAPFTANRSRPDSSASRYPTSYS